MCTYSMIADHYNEKWKRNDWIIPNWPTQPSPISPQITRDEFEALRKDVLEMKELLKRAIKYDIDHNQPHCEMDDKVELIKRMAKELNINIEDIVPRV